VVVNFLVCDLACDVVDGSKDLMGAFVGRLRDWLIVKRGLWFRFGPWKILLLLSKMAFGEMFANEVSGEAWPSSKVTVLNRFDPG
jgi:hypothetical protein